MTEIRKGLHASGLFQILAEIFRGLRETFPSRLSQVVIVTNAGTRTVENFYLQFCLPELAELCAKEQVYIHSTEHVVKRLGSIPPITDEEAYREFYTTSKVRRRRRRKRRKTNPASCQLFSSCWSFPFSCLLSIEGDREILFACRRQPVVWRWCGDDRFFFFFSSLSSLPSSFFGKASFLFALSLALIPRSLSASSLGALRAVSFSPPFPPVYVCLLFASRAAYFVCMGASLRVFLQRSFFPRRSAQRNLPVWGGGVLSL